MTSKGYIHFCFLVPGCLCLCKFTNFIIYWSNLPFDRNFTALERPPLWTKLVAATMICPLIFTTWLLSPPHTHFYSHSTQLFRIGDGGWRLGCAAAVFVRLAWTTERHTRSGLVCWLSRLAVVSCTVCTHKVSLKKGLPKNCVKGIKLKLPKEY